MKFHHYMKSIYINSVDPSFLDKEVRLILIETNFIPAYNERFEKLDNNKVTPGEFKPRPAEAGDFFPIIK